MLTRVPLNTTLVSSLALTVPSEDLRCGFPANSVAFLSTSLVRSHSLQWPFGFKLCGKRAV